MSIIGEKVKDHKFATKAERYEASVGFPVSSLPTETKSDFIVYVRNYMPKPTDANIFEGDTTNMKFEYFLTVYRLSLMWAFTYFKPQKEAFAKKRRALLDLKTDDPQVR